MLTQRGLGLADALHGDRAKGRIRRGFGRNIRGRLGAQAFPVR
jgi:hypothetical protein